MMLIKYFRCLFRHGSNPWLVPGKSPMGNPPMSKGAKSPENYFEYFQRSLLDLETETDYTARLLSAYKVFDEMYS